MSSDRFQELLPWYVNGTISDADRDWVDRHVAEDPLARAELDWYRSLSTRMKDSAPAVPATIGLSKVMTLIRGDRPTFAERLSAFFGGFAMRPAFALAGFAIIAAQTGLIFNLLGDKDESAEMRAAQTVPVKEGPLVKLNFTPDAKEADIRLLLMSVQGSLVGGPGQLGDYYVRVAAGKEATAAAQLKAAPIVQAVTLAPGLPPRP
ncbi:MAG: zf-HC2 domain-containing protein [Burkholderiales bacterium]